MPSFDLSLTGRLINAGIPAALATDVAAAISAAPAFTSAVAITGGTINGASVGVTTPAVVKASDFQGAITDISGTPGNGTVNTPTGRAAFAAAGSTVTITSSLVAATSKIMVTLEGAADTTLTGIVGVTPGAGSFVVTGNAAATATKKFSFVVFN